MKRCKHEYGWDKVNIQGTEKIKCKKCGYLTGIREVK